MKPIQRRLPLDVLEEGVDRRPDRVRRSVRQRLAELAVEDRPDLAERRLGDRRYEAVAVDEVAIQDRFGDPAGGRHLLHRDVGAPPADHLDRGVEQLATTEQAPLGQRRTGPFDLRASRHARIEPRSGRLTTG